MKRTEELKEIKLLSKDDLKKRIQDTELELSNLRFQSATQALTNPTKLRTLRRSIARMKTLLNDK